MTVKTAIRLLVRSVALGVSLCAVAASHGNAQTRSPTVDWAKVTAEAAKEGEVVVYGVLIPATIQLTIDAFKKAHPNIRLQIVRDIDSAIALRVRQEQSVNAKGADIIVQSSYDPIDAQIGLGMLVPPTGPNAAAFGKALYRDVAPILSSMPVGIAYNTELAKTPVDSYQDLLRPEFKGAISIMSIDAGAAPISWYDYIRNRYPDFWTRLAAQNPKFYASSVPLVQGVASGEAALGGWGLPAIASPLIQKGAPLKVAIDKTESFGIEFVGGILKNAHDPNAAQVFMNFMMSLEGQEALNGGSRGISALPGVPGALPPTRMVSVDPKIYTPEKLKQIAEEWKAVFK